MDIDDDETSGTVGAVENEAREVDLAPEEENDTANDNIIEAGAITPSEVRRKFTGKRKVKQPAAQRAKSLVKKRRIRA